MQIHDDRAIFQASPEELPAIDIHSLEPLPDARSRQSREAAGHGETPRTSPKTATSEGEGRRKMRTTDRTMPFGPDIYGFTHIQVLPDRQVFADHGIEGELLHRLEKRADGSLAVG